MKKALFARALCLLLVVCTLLSFASCKRISLVVLPENLVAAYQKQATTSLDRDEQLRRETVLTDYAWKLYSELLSEVSQGDNQLFSPLSLEFALGMVANGSVGETRAESSEPCFLQIRSG